MRELNVKHAKAQKIDCFQSINKNAFVKMVTTTMI